MQPAPLDVAVIGAGVVGASTALGLARAGHRVRLFDPRGLCGGTSYGNAGGVHIGAILPMASPTIVLDALRMLADPVGPLMLDWRYLPRALPWLARFVLQGTPARVRAAAAATATINHHAVAAWRGIAALAGASAHLHEVGWLKVYDREEDFRAGATERALMQEHGFRYELLDAKALHDMEPALGPTLLRGMWQPDSLFVDNPGRAVRAIGEAAIAAGAVFHTLPVTHIDARPERCVLRAGTAEHAVERVVLAAGAWSGPLARSVGARVPLDTERGYHVMLPTPARNLTRPVLFPRRRFVLCPMQEGLRITACVEIAGLQRGPDYRRIEKLLPFAATLLPGMDTRIQDRWLGYRPSLPDARPVIDIAGHGRVVLAFGHGHLGLTQGPATALAAQALVEGREPPFSLHPYRADRFRGLLS
jgi:D-amino-acid dehydrogenase